MSIINNLSSDSTPLSGAIVTVESHDNKHPLHLSSSGFEEHSHSEPKQIKWLMLNSSEDKTTATLWVNDKFLEEFLSIFDNFGQVSDKDKKFISSIGSIRPAVAMDLWTSFKPPATDEVAWRELWLEPRIGDYEEMLRVITSLRGINMLSNSTRLPDAVIYWIESSWEELDTLVALGIPIAEIRKPTFASDITFN